MNTKPTTSSFIVRAALLLLTVFTTTVTWAQSTTVSDEQQLLDAITDGATNIQLTKDIKLSNYLNINGITVTIDLNGHRLYRELSEHGSAGHVIYANGGCNLTLTSTAEDYGIIEGGKANNGGAINITHGNTVTATNVTFQNNSAGDHAGAIWNNGTFTATNCTFENNTANDVGAIYNAVQTVGSDTYAGTATLAGCTFKGNKGTAGAGALANAVGNTVMTIDGCTIKDNTAGCDGGAGIWNGGTLNMKGAITVKDNMNVGGVVSNVYLKNGTLITVTGSLSGSHIGVDMESTMGTFTSGYNSHNSGVDPKTIFTADRSIIMDVGVTGDEVELYTWYSANTLTYIERSWDGTNKKVVSTEKVLTALITYGEAPEEGKGQYKEVTNPPDDEPDQWFLMGGYSTTVPEYYVVRGDVTRQTIIVQGSNVHLILCDGATLTLNRGLKLEGTNKLYIHSQSYGNDMGKLKVIRGFGNAAGIGSAWANEDGGAIPAGELVIYGGDLDVKGGQYGAGIGSCRYSKDNAGGPFSNSVTVYGGKVKAKGGMFAAGIGGGGGVRGGDFILYDGIVNAIGGEGTSSHASVMVYSDCNGGAGIGGGYGSYGGNVTVYGGTLTAKADMGAAGIGSAGLDRTESNAHELRGGTFTMYDGTVTATGHGGGAGIGGGSVESGINTYVGNGGRLTISGGTVTATGGYDAAGIGGGTGGSGAIVTISGGTVTAKGGFGGAGIGGGFNSEASCKTDGGTLTISGGTVTATGGEKASGIGGGLGGAGGIVTITGGTVIAKAGNQGGEGNRAIGPGKEINNYGTLTIGYAMMVGAGNDGSVERIYDADERVNACWYRSYAEISPCTHPSGITYTINDDGTHTMHCGHCTTKFDAEPHDFDELGVCRLCHYSGTTYRVYVWLPVADEDGIYETDGIYTSYVYDMVAGTSFTLPGAPQDLYDMEFAGWLVGISEVNSHYKASADEMSQLLPEKAPYTLEGEVNFVARYKDIDISLADNGDNDEKLYTYKGRKAASVTLTGRKLWKDGDWNTLCLPFSLSAEQISASDLAGADIRTLNSTTFSNGTLTLNFTGVGDVTSITAGTPYIVKWTNTTPDYIENPEFTDVTIVETTTNVETDFADFVGNYSPRVYTDTIQNVLFLGAGNTLYYPQPTLTNPNAEYDAETNPRVPVTIGACRAVFLLKNGLVCGEPAEPASGINNFVLNFGDDETGITETSNLKSQISTSTSWFTIDGRKLNGKPISKGIYINNGRKVVIK